MRDTTLWFEMLKKEKDACYHKVRSRYKKWPSAYASGAVVKCRQGKIWKGVKEDIEKIVKEEINALKKTNEGNMDDKPYRTDAQARKDVLGEEPLEEKKKKTDYSKEKESGLHGWFSRAGGKGKSKGWVDCNTCRKDKKTKTNTAKQSLEKIAPGPISAAICSEVGIDG